MSPDDRPASPWTTSLLTWYEGNKRAMPWRANRAPYPVWISEVMLQQTQVRTVIPFFRRFMDRFPSLQALAGANEQQVLKAWEGLGYYARARNLRRTAAAIVTDHAGRFPRTASGLRALPGIGDYTAAAVASICFGEPIPAVDGNVLRVIARLDAIPRDIRRPATRSVIAGRLAAAIAPFPPGDFNQALMELGALVCRPRQPLCDVCPVRSWCKARQRSAVDRFPVKSPRKAIPHFDIVAAIIRKGPRILITRRRADQMLGGLWEFPGGKQEPGEALEATVHREIMEETGLRIEVGPALCSVKHAYSHFRITLHAFLCRYVSGRARKIQNNGVCWVSPTRLGDYPFPAADRRIIERLTGKAAEGNRHARTNHTRRG